MAPYVKQAQALLADIEAFQAAKKAKLASLKSLDLDQFSGRVKDQIIDPVRVAVKALQFNLDRVPEQLQRNIKEAYEITAQALALNPCYVRNLIDKVKGLTGWPGRLQQLFAEATEKLAILSEAVKVAAEKYSEVKVTVAKNQFPEQAISTGVVEVDFDPCTGKARR